MGSLNNRNPILLFSPICQRLREKKREFTKTNMDRWKLTRIYAICFWTEYEVVMLINDFVIIIIRMMNNFVFVQKPGEVNYQFKEPIDLNRNFTNSYMSSQVFIKKDSSVSSQSFLEGRSDYTGIDIPVSPNLAK